MYITISPYIADWLDLLLRWLHVVAAIVWIGTSFYFVALDNHLRPPEEPRDGVGGESWEIHGGGFYRVEKYRVAPPALPEPLHWFKWEAYTTWLSGFALFVVLYWVDADTLLIDKSVADLAVWQAITISAALLAAAWLVYDGLCRLLGRRELLFAAVLTVLVAATAYGLSHVFGGRAVYLQVGAMLGTIMVANVFFVIIPAHWELVRAKEAGREPDARPGMRGKERSVHNNYLTLPVVFAMISTHFPSAYGHEHAWAVLVAVMVIGAWLRHFFNVRHRGLNLWPIPVTAAVGIAAVAVWARPESAPARAVSLEEAQAIVARRCLLCHTGADSRSGVPLETPEAMRRRADQIREQVETRAMPLGNATGMTDEERELLVAWAAGER